MSDINLYLHDTYKLLSIYRMCVWNLSESVDDIREKLYMSFENTLLSSPARLNISELIRAIDEYDVDISKTSIENRFKSFYKSTKLIEFADASLIKLKSFPLNGEKYFDLLYELYFNTNVSVKPKTVDVMDKLGYYDSKSFYSYKKSAVKLFNAILWDSYEEELFKLRPYIAKKAEAYDWIDNNSLTYKKYKK